MLRALYTSGTAMMVQNKRMNVITNNITNVATDGYKTDELLSRSFRDMMIDRINDPYVQVSAVGPHNTGIHIDIINTDFTQGSLSDSERPTDVAIVGDGFFVIQTPDGERYSRAGAFARDTDGMLLTPDGYFVMGENGPLNVGTGEFTIDATGNVYREDTLVDRIRIVGFEDNAVLRKTGNNLYVPFDDTQPVNIDANVRQYMLEGSNVDAAAETVRMIETARAFETNQRMVKMLDESLGKAVNDIARF
ncbi:flagellar hook-basal body protein [Oscillospiraceae bacterium OttesenSCG-928-G22]|nr:flagellar hook-basal body protein [Oscillospiraceae bacterium OttesenSCG-928-G22]